MAIFYGGHHRGHYRTGAGTVRRSMLNMLTHRRRKYKSPLWAILLEYLGAVFEHSLVTEAIFDGDRIIIQTVNEAEKISPGTARDLLLRRAA
jgi:hypothetical protein